MDDLTTPPPHPISRLGDGRCPLDDCRAPNFDGYCHKCGHQEVRQIQQDKKKRTLERRDSGTDHNGKWVRGVERNVTAEQKRLMSDYITSFVRVSSVRDISSIFSTLFVVTSGLRAIQTHLALLTTPTRFISSFYRIT